MEEQKELFHYSSEQNIERIIENNFLQSSVRYKGISFTTDENYHKGDFGLDYGNTRARIVLDNDKLIADGFIGEYFDHNTKSNVKGKESEYKISDDILVYKNPNQRQHDNKIGIPNIKKYIKRVELFDVLGKIDVNKTKDTNKYYFNEMAEGGNVGTKPILAYHRSPNKFNKFKISNISTDSNRQRYGYGLYFSNVVPNEQYGENLHEVTLFKDKKEYVLIDTKSPVEEDIVNKIIEALKADGKKPNEVVEFAYNGFLFYKTVSRILGGDKNASLFLAKNGIDGLKINQAKNFNDYVLFNDDSITIEDVNGQSIKETPQAGSVGEITFTDYKGEQIMYEPHNREYFVISNDENIFNSLEDAKAFIDNPKSVIQTEYAKMVRGEMDGEIRFAEGGSVGDNFYNNKDMSNQQAMQVQFDLIKAELDKQKYKNKSVISFAKGKIEEMLKENPSAYPFYVEKYLDLPKSVRDSLNPFSEEFDGSASPVMKWLKEQDKNVFDVVKVEEYSLPKTKVIQTNPDDKNFMDIHSDFVNYDNTARTIMMATHFNENGIVSTDAHKMLITPYRGNSKKLEGNFCHTKKCIEYYKSKKITSDDRFPAWKQVIPLSNIEYEMNAAAVYDFIKNAIKYELMNTVTNSLVFKYGEEKIGFNANLMLTCIQGMSELGHKELSIAISTPSRAALIIPKGRLEDANNLKTDFALLMPVMLSNYSWEDDMTYFGKFNLETSCYTDPNELIYCFDAEKVKVKKAEKKVKQLEKKLSQKDIIDEAIDDIVKLLNIVPEGSEEENTIRQNIKDLHELKQII